MKSREELEREVETLEQRIATLSAAVLRLGSSLELATVLQEAADSARALTGTRYCLIVTVDEAGEAREFVTSGLTSDEYHEFVEWPEGPRLFALLRNLPAPFHLDDLSGHIRALGFSDELVRTKTMHGTTMRHRGVEVGNFFLGGKEDANRFDAADEEMLELFASQAAAAIVNARAHEQEQRARADLEALIETTPVGVMVLDARTGRPVSSNREADRLVEPLRAPGGDEAGLPETVTCRFGDGRQIALDAPALAEELKKAGTVRADEIVLSTSDGRSVSILVNATPIHGEDGDVASVVVTMQDLAPLEELDRQRAEFLGLVSHELRTPLAAIKGSTATVLGASPAFHPVELHQFFRVIDEQADRMQRLIGDLLDAGRIEAGALSLSPVPTGVAELVEQARKAFVNGGATHAVLVDLPEELPLVLADGPRIVQVLNNLLANAARHSPGSSPIRVAAVRDGPHVAVSVSDEGQGVPAEQLPRLFRKYTGPGGDEREQGLRGSGLGLAICKGLVEAHGGRIRAESGGPGQGARFTFTVPVAGDAARAPAGGRALAAGRDGQRPPVLVVDDDPRTLRFVRDALAQAGYAPLATADPGDISEIVRAKRPCLVLLDLMLPGADGIELMETVPELADLPVIFISAYGRDETVARALEKGAADYLVKPFSATELTARIQAALRKQAGPETFTLGGLAVHYEERRATVAGQPVPLTATEYDLLRLLTLNAGRVSTYEWLIRQLWNGPDSAEPDRVRTFVKQLRRKLGDDPKRPAYILNVRGVGYRVPRPEA
ncbi:MAG: response regulator [Alphaproteobacteria bacterium]|nr:response regulator [Alphaproteobacteria bacterium]